MNDDEIAAPGDAQALARWVVRWESAVAASRMKGQTDDTAWGQERILVGAPATAEELRDIETASRMPMPDGVRRLFRVARSVDATWHFSDQIEPPPPFSQIFAGTCEWSIEHVPAVIERYRGWVEQVFPDPNDPYDSVWHGKYPLLHVPNGDQVGVDADGHVIYLSHDDGEGHGYILGQDVFDFLDRWTALGCPGPEDWQWLPFASASDQGLDPEGENGRLWRGWFGIR